MTTHTAQPDIDSLLDAMTLEEQVSLLSGQDFWSTVPIERLGIPSVKVSDGPNGARGGIFKNGPRTACFPVGVSVASTWNPELVESMGEALATETRLKGAQVILAPTVNLQRTVYNGRNFECHSEDPWLASEMAVAYVRGVQSQGVAATLKHFVGNESEYQRMTASSEIPERALRELYLLPFERAVKEAAAMCVMTGYNRLGGTFAADHDRLIDEILRKEWGFDGLVMSDWFANHHTELSVVAGCDLEMPGPTRERGGKLVAAVREGRVPAAAVRACARRVLALAARLGRFEDPEPQEERADDLPAHRALIRRLGAEGTVLLKNDGEMLPLKLDACQKVALIGLAATEPQIMGGGSANVNAHYRVSPLAGLQAACPGVEFVTSPGADLHRYTPLLNQPVTLEYFDSEDLTGPVVATETLPSSEAIWADHAPAGVTLTRFSVRARLRYTAERAGVHQFSLISAGISRARLDGGLAVDAWSGWKRGDSYFTWGCDEVLHQRRLQAGQSVEIELEYSTATPGQEKAFRAMRFGAARLQDHGDIDAAVAIARDAEVAIVFAGLNAEWDNEGVDRPGIELPHLQNELIRRVAAANPHTVVVLQSGSPLLLPWLQQVPAVLQAWYPGQECGNAIADMLTGAVEPGGRLPQTWPRRIEDSVAYGRPAAYPGVDGRVHYDEGLLIGYRHHDAHGIAPQFAFGHGLSYTRFELGQLSVDRSRFAPGEPVTATLTVRNTGQRSGQVVVQAYVHDQASTLSRPPQELKAFRKIRLEPGAEQQVQLVFGPRAFAAYDDRRAAWVAEAGGFELRVGISSEHTPLRTTVTLEQDWTEPAGR